ncbi:Npun_R2821/Npun_R2822 family protein [Nostoc sp.]|uniref:Npun_R2821/Npun_R2822 family protein n=1 Tax=Nostoc sp. TaxID=1180 RepID=UPI002FF4D6B6
MESFGIYTLANDVVYDQLVAFLNSIEVNFSPDIPVCIIPYDERLDLVQKEVKSRKNVSIFDNWEAIQSWEDFAHQVWGVHPGTRTSKISRNWWSSGHLQRKMCVFNGDFDRFIFCDADSLLMKPVDDIFEKLNAYDFVFDDWIHTKERTKVPLNIPLLEKSKIVYEKDIRPKLHCSDFFGSKSGLFPEKDLDLYKKLLIEDREVEWLTTWWDDAHLFNYLTWKSNLALFNFTLSPNGQDRTGNCANSDPFVNIDNILYNQDELKPIHRIHYMNYSSIDFARLCQGEDVNICYREEFLYYRFLKEPEKRPQQLKQPSIPTKSNRLIQKVVKKLQITLS